MSPEELNRAMEFITASQARLAAAQEQDRQDRIEFQKWSKHLIDRLNQNDQMLAQNEKRLSQLLEKQNQIVEKQNHVLEYQSNRMDRLDKFYEDALAQTGDLQRQALHLLHLILDRLPPLGV